MIHTDVFAKLLGVLKVIQARPAALSLEAAAASVVALTIVLRYLTAKQPKLITDYAKVAREVADDGVEFDEWDFIIVGGGMPFHTNSRMSYAPNAPRHGRMCSGITSLRRPKPAGSTHRGWWKVSIFECIVCF
jgi:choline dehydrogenase